MMVNESPVYGGTLWLRSFVAFSAMLSLSSCGFIFVGPPDCLRPGVCGATGRIMTSHPGVGIGELTLDDWEVFVPNFDAQIQSIAFTETTNGLRLLVASDVGLLDYSGTVYDSLGRTIVVDRCASMRDVAVSGNFAFVTCPNEHRIAKVDLETGTVVTDFECCEGLGETEPRTIIVTLDGKLFAGSSKLFVFDSISGENLGLAIGTGIQGAERYDDLVFSPAGNLLVSSNPDVGVLEFDGENLAFLRVLISAGASFTQSSGLALALNGNLLVASAAEGTVSEFDMESGAFLQTWLESDIPIEFIAVRP